LDENIGVVYNYKSQYEKEESDQRRRREWAIRESERLRARKGK